LQDRSNPGKQNLDIGYSLLDIGYSNENEELKPFVLSLSKHLRFTRPPFD